MKRQGYLKPNLKRNQVRDLREKTQRKSAEVLHLWKEKNRKKVNSNLKGNLKLAIPRNPGQNLRETWKNRKPQEAPYLKREKSQKKANSRLRENLKLVIPKNPGQSL